MEYKTSNWQILVAIILLSGLIYSKLNPTKKVKNEPKNISANPKINPRFSPILGDPDGTLKSNESIKVKPKIKIEYIPPQKLVKNATNEQHQILINKSNSLDGEEIKDLYKYFNDINEINKTNSNSYLNKDSKFNLYFKEKSTKDSI
jgi:hypothetical protein